MLKLKDKKGEDNGYTASALENIKDNNTKDNKDSYGYNSRKV